MQQARIFLANALKVRVYIELFDEGDGDFVPHDGEASVYFSAEPDGASIDVALELPLSPTADAGVYEANVTRDLVDEHFTAFVGKPVYQIVEAGPDGELTFVTTRLVTNPRYAAT